MKFFSMGPGIFEVFQRISFCMGSVLVSASGCLRFCQIPEHLIKQNPDNPMPQNPMIRHLPKPSRPRRSTFSLPALAVCFSWLAVTPLSAQQDIPKIPIGMNLTAINDYTSGFPFKNLPSTPWSAPAEMLSDARASRPPSSSACSRVAWLWKSSSSWPI